MNFIGQNIRYLRKEKGITQEQLANKLGVNRSMIGAYEENRAEPKLQTMLSICHYFNIDINTLVQRDISNSKIENPIVDIKGQQLRILPILIDKSNDKELISVVPVKASAGYLNGYGDVDYIESLQKFSMPVPEISSDKTYRVFQITGDSMLPVKPGSYIICEYVHDWFEVRNEKCYVLITRDDGIVYKRLLNNLKEGHLVLKSDNPEYKPYTVKPENIVEIWKALGYISFTLPEVEESNNQFEKIVNELRKDVGEIKKNLFNAG